MKSNAISKFAYILTSVAAILLLSISCKRDHNICRVKFDFQNFREADSTIQIRIENDSIYITDTIKLTPPNDRIKYEVSANAKRILLYFNEGENVLTFYPEKDQDVKIRLDANFPLLYQIKGGGTNKTLEEFRLFAEKEIRQYQELLHSDSLKQKTKALKEVRLKAIEFYRQHLESPGIEKLSEIYLRDINFLQDSTLSIQDTPLADYLRLQDSCSVGRLAPDFHIKDIEQKDFILSWNKKKPILLHFTDSLSKHTASFLKAKKDSLKKEDPTILTLVLSIPDSSIRTAASRLKLPGHIVSDSIGQTATLMEKYNIRQLPYTIRIDTLGTIIERSSGYSLP